MKEYLEGRNLITKLQAKHDLLQKTLGESECGTCWSLLLARLLRSMSVTVLDYRCKVDVLMFY